MTEAEIEAVNAIDSALSIFREKTKLFNKESDAAVAEAKKRTGQLNDYMGRLSVAVDKLNAVLSSGKMAQAVENADRLVKALEILDVLEANGSLSRIMTAMAVKEGEQ